MKLNETKLSEIGKTIIGKICVSFKIYFSFFLTKTFF